VHAIKGLDLAEQIREGGIGVCTDGGDEIVVIATKILQHIPDEFIIINGLPSSSKFLSNCFHLGEKFVGNHVTFLGFNQGSAQMLHPRL
jgi:hypothetical protein